MWEENSVFPSRWTGTVFFISSTLPTLQHGKLVCFSQALLVLIPKMLKPDDGAWASQKAKAVTRLSVGCAPGPLLCDSGRKRWNGVEDVDSCQPRDTAGLARGSSDGDPIAQQVGRVSMVT